MGVWLADNPPCKINTVRKHNEPRKDGNHGYQTRQRTRTNDLSFATWNVRSLYKPGAMREMCDQLLLYKVDICAVQEMRWPGNGVIHKPKYALFYSGNNNDKHQFGTGFYVNKLILNNILDFQPISERICVLRVKSKFYNITLMSIHAPTEEKSDLIKEQFYMELENVYDKIPKYDMKIIMGDFNAKVGKERYLTPACGKHSLHEETNKNGKMMVNFANGRDLAVEGTWFKHKDIHKRTWTSPDKQTFNQIDHILVDRRHSASINDVRSLRGAEIGSDHYLVRAKVRVKINNLKLTKRSEMVKWDINKLEDGEISKTYAENVMGGLKKMEVNGKNSQELWNKIKNCINDAAEKSIGKEGKPARNEWFDEECKVMLDEKKLSI